MQQVNYNYIQLFRDYNYNIYRKQKNSFVCNTIVAIKYADYFNNCFSNCIATRSFLLLSKIEYCLRLLQY